MVRYSEYSGTNIYAYEDELFTTKEPFERLNIEPEYTYINPAFYELGNYYYIIISEDLSQMELIDASSSLLKSINVCTDQKTIEAVFNILEGTVIE